MNSIENTIQLFRSAGYRITPQRRAIFGILASNENHPNTEAVYASVKQGMPDISLTTVYNTLKEMTDLGLVGIVSSVNENAIRYDPKTTNHHHLHCLKCHRILDVEFDFHNLELPKKESGEFQIVNQQVTFFGFCPACQKTTMEERKTS